MKKFFKTLLSILALLGATQIWGMGDEADRLLGVWEPSNGRARVKIEKVGTKYQGKIIWLKEPNDPKTGLPKTDKENSDPALKKGPLMGCRMLKGFEYEGKNVWSDGTIYDPQSGKTYSCIIKMNDPNTLHIRGYIGISAFGRTDTWKRQPGQK
jgi:uncharacterized protein (DUF2147 family)